MRSMNRKMRKLVVKAVAGLAMTVGATTFSSSCTDGYMTTQGQGFRSGNFGQGLGNFGYEDCHHYPNLPWC